MQSKAAKLLAGTDPYTETVLKGGTTYYRARFAGFDQDKAEAACKFLKRNDVECMTGQELTSNEQEAVSGQELSR